MDDVDRALVVGIALAETGEVAQVAAGREHGADARHLRDRLGVLQPFERLDHENEDEVVVDGLPVAARHAAPHGAVKRLTAAVAALAERREIRPVPRGDRFLDGVDGRHDEDERTGIERMLLFTFVGVRDAHAGHGLRVRTRPPHVRDFLPVVGVVLHLGPDEVVARVRERAVCRRIARREERPARHLLPRHQLQLHGIPDLRSRRRIPRGAVLPRVHVERTLIHRAGRRGVFCVAVLPGLRGERKGTARCHGVFSRARLLARWRLLLRVDRNDCGDGRERGHEHCLFHRELQSNVVSGFSRTSAIFSNAAGCCPRARRSIRPAPVAHPEYAA